MQLTISPEETVVYWPLFYMGEIRVNVIGWWKHLKHLLHPDSVMNKRQTLMEKRVALVMLAYAMVCSLEEGRDQV